MSSEEQADPTLADYVDVLRRNIRLILVVALAFPVLAFLWSAQQSAMYRASAEVMLEHAESRSAVTGISIGYVDPARFGETQATLARVPAVVQSAIKRAKVQRPDDGRARSRTRPSRPGTTPTSSPSRSRTVGARHATRLATAYARAFTSYKLQLGHENALARARESSKSRLEELRERVRRERSPLSATCRRRSRTCGRSSCCRHRRPSWLRRSTRTQMAPDPDPQRSPRSRVASFRSRRSLC